MVYWRSYWDNSPIPSPTVAAAKASERISSIRCVTGSSIYGKSQRAKGCLKASALRKKNPHRTDDFSLPRRRLKVRALYCPGRQTEDSRACACAKRATVRFVFDWSHSAVSFAAKFECSKALSRCALFGRASSSMAARGPCKGH